jgi:peptidoglycan hydrolase-like protein with peptidoglycan-binding domain
MTRKHRLISIAGIVLFCALTYFAFSSTTALAAERPGSQPTTTQKPPAQKLVCPPTVRYNDRGDAVRKLQTALNKQAIKDSHGHPLKGNGVFDKATLEAVKNFQAKHHLKVDGVAGPDVWRLLGQCNMR